MGGTGDRSEVAERRVDDDPPLRRWTPVVFVIVACTVVLVGLGAAVYVAKTTAPDGRKVATTVQPTLPAHLHGRSCIALGITVVGSPAVRADGGYRLHIAATDRRSCLLRPDEVALVARQANGAKRVFAAPPAPTRIGPTVQIDYAVRFSRRCRPGRGHAEVLLSVGGSQLDVPGATLPAGLANCRRVTMTATVTR